MDEVIVDFHKSAFNHEINKEDIIHALKHRIHDASIDGFSDKYAVIGPNRAGNLLEILFDSIDENNICVYHAMNIRKSFIKRLGL